MRALDNGMKIKVALVNSKPFSVDTKEDLKKIRNFLKHKIIKLGANMNIISFQGLPGSLLSFSLQKILPNFKTLPCENFEDTFKAVEMNKADLAMIPIENSTAGRVSDIHFLIQNTKLKIVAEYYQEVNIVCYQTKTPNSLI